MGTFLQHLKEGAGNINHPDRKPADLPKAQILDQNTSAFQAGSPWKKLALKVTDPLDTRGATCLIAG